MNNALSAVVKGSIKSMGDDEALSILDAKLLLICDRSSSMADIGKNGKRCYEVEDEIVRKIQERNPGKIVIMSFSDYPELNTDGVLPVPNGGTNYTPALEMAKDLVESGLRAVFITDGQPMDNRASIYNAASHFIGKMDVIYVGREGDEGERFARDFANYLRGQFTSNDLGSKSAVLLEETLNKLLLTAG